jgi:predicted phosphodiesterase
MKGSLGKIGVIGDVHAEDEFLASALLFLESLGLDLVVCLGDVADGKGSANRCCALLQARGTATVRGNHDRWLLEGTNRGVEDATRPYQVSHLSLQFLGSLPLTLEYPTLGGPLLVCHGLGEHDLASVRQGDTAEEIYNNLELCGHTHRREVRRFHHLVVVTAGTLHRSQTPGCAVVDVGSEAVEFYDLDTNGGGRPAGRIRWPE